MIVSYLRSFGGATKGELNILLRSKLSDVLSDEQKSRKISNLLSSLKLPPIFSQAYPNAVLRVTMPKEAKELPRIV